MLHRNLDGSAAKRRNAAQPLVDDSRQRILIAGRTRAPLQLLRGKVERGTRDLLSHKLRAIDVGLRIKHGQTKIAEQEFISGTSEDIFRLDIAMDQIVAVRIV